MQDTHSYEACTAVQIATFDVICTSIWLSNAATLLQLNWRHLKVGFWRAKIAFLAHSHLCRRVGMTQVQLMHLQKIPPRYIPRLYSNCKCTQCLAQWLWQDSKHHLRESEDRFCYTQIALREAYCLGSLLPFMVSSMLPSYLQKLQALFMGK